MKYIDENLALADIPSGAVFLQDLSPKLKSNRNVILALMKIHPQEFSTVLRDFRNDKKIALIAVAQFGQNLSHCSFQLRDDTDIVKTALKENGNNLQYASAKLKKNFSICHFAIKCNAHAYRFIHSSLKYNDELIRLALQHQGMAFECMPNRIKENEEYFALALNQNPAAFCYGTENFKLNPHYIEKTLLNSSNLEFMPFFKSVTKLDISPNQSCYGTTVSRYCPEDMETATHSPVVLSDYSVNPHLGLSFAFCEAWINWSCIFSRI